MIKARGASSEARANSISLLAPCAWVHATRSLRTPPPRSPLEIHPLAHLHVDGRLELLQAAFPPLGATRLVLWHPGREPAFSVVAGRIERGWRWEGPRVEGEVVLWLSQEDPTQPI